MSKYGSPISSLPPLLPSPTLLLLPDAEQAMLQVLLGLELAWAHLIRPDEVAYSQIPPSHLGR